MKQEGGEAMKRALPAFLVVLVTLTLGSQAAFAGSPHFVGTPTITSSGDSANSSGKVAGLGNEASIFVTVDAQADCINGGTHHPKATNKETVEASGQFPVQNGKADFSEGLTTSLSCSPPMTISWSLISITVYEGCDSLSTCTSDFAVLTYP
jgi:hypothetical protein